ncbi:MAG: tRNA(Ile)-lysidine synthetase, partial [Chloroflexi bacterium]
MDEFPRTRITGAFERRVASALDRLVPQPECVIVACSGGPDSTAALVAIARSGQPLVVAHFDHRMRSDAESKADRAAVATLATQFAVPLLAGRGSGHARSEDDARTERYRWLASAAVESGVTACVTGHTLDDQAETVLLRLTRGASLTGAAGMAESAPWPI